MNCPITKRPGSPDRGARLFIIALASAAAFLLPRQFAAGQGPPDPQGRSADVRVIVHKDMNIEWVSKSDLQKVFLGTKTSIEGVVITRLATLSSGAAHETFLRVYLGKSEFTFRNYWKRRVFTGKGGMPKSFATEEELADYVGATRGSIGYVGSDVPPGEARVVSIVQ